MPAADIIMLRPSSDRSCRGPLQPGFALRARAGIGALHNFHAADPAGTVFAILISDNTPAAPCVRRNDKAE